jgi:translocation and assembly module TamB
MKMDILLRGSIGQPILLGKVEAKEGIVYFRNNEFKVLKASVDFANPNQVNPYFDIAAETRVRNYNIRLNLDGYIEQFNLSLSSSPALDETDIFSLLTVGQMGKHLKGLEGGIGAGEATSFITGKLQDVFEERLKTITGFDRVQIDPYISKSTGTVTPRVTIAKRLLGDKLYVTYSTAVGTGEEQVLKLEYTLGKNTSLVGLRDERGGIGGDIKFRFEFK